MKKFIAFLLDVVFCFFIPGYILALIFGGIESSGGSVGFTLTGFPMLIGIGIVILYIYLSRKVWGKSWGQRIMKV